VPPADSAALAASLARLIADPASRARLGAAGERRVRRDFDADAAIELLARRFGLAPPVVQMPARELIDAS
jgi:glycosyltransferase involved in cell wall biosynthesis